MVTRTRRGFTLLELIIVIVVLAILAALAIPTFTAVINRSKKSSADTSAMSVARNAIYVRSFTEQGADLASMQAAADELTPGGVVTVAVPTVATPGSTIYHVALNAKSACVQVDNGVNGQAKPFTLATVSIGGAPNTTGCM